MRGFALSYITVNLIPLGFELLDESKTSFKINIFALSFRDIWDIFYVDACVPFIFIFFLYKPSIQIIEDLMVLGGIPQISK